MVESAKGWWVLRSLLLRPLPVMKPASVVAVNTEASAAFGTNTTISYPDYVDLRDRSRTFEGLVAVGYTMFGFSRDRETLSRIDPMRALREE